MCYFLRSVDVLGMLSLNKWISQTSGGAVGRSVGGRAGVVLGVSFGRRAGLGGVSVLFDALRRRAWHAVSEQMDSSNVRRISAPSVTDRDEIPPDI